MDAQINVSLIKTKVCTAKTGEKRWKKIPKRFPKKWCFPNFFDNFPYGVLRGILGDFDVREGKKPWIPIFIK